MKVAFLTPYLPFPPDTGGKIRSYHLLKQLGRRHEVHAFSVHYEEHPQGVDEIGQICARLHLSRLSKPWTRSWRFKRLLSSTPRSVDHFHTPASLATVRRELETGGYDLVFVDELVMAAYTAGLRCPSRILAQQKIDYRHYWETACARPWSQDKLLDFLEFVKLRRFQAVTLADRYPLVVVCSTDDERLLKGINPRINTVIMPNGVDTDHFRPLPADPSGQSADSPPTLIYTGTMFYYPNVDAALYFWREMYPHIVARVPNVRILIVGHNPPPEVKKMGELPNVTLTGTVPDVRPYLSQSTAMIVPLRLGGGTRLKILEAMAMGVPVITTTVGCQGLAVKDREDVLIADAPREFAARTVELLTDPGLRRHLAARGRQVALRYDWSVLVQRLLDAWQALPDSR